MKIMIFASELFLKAMREAQAYKYAKQKGSDADLGDEPIIEWFKKEWSAWYRERWLDHLCGRRCWVEFGKDDFNLIADRSFQPNLNLVLRIIDNLKKHRTNVSENLGLIFSAAKDDKDLKGHRRPSYDELRLRVFFAAIEEADKHKYIESQKVGFDLGEKSVEEWFDKYWPEFAVVHGVSPDSMKGEEC
jgi:hypothetical protein